MEKQEQMRGITVSSKKKRAVSINDMLIEKIIQSRYTLFHEVTNPKESS